ncbi:hypothetical protein GLX30_31030 [Streptomyces sp. Tu 2975]|uniref:hypothetical protein n=1 Tax=Streptomyces sp. Tu 2975 TaxID=2676871 RepID=UPI00135ADBEF|nr:hypothetical protein [Streptomyces sp. Tu 2975]QIP87730.1 hypothetical protein GLX30_31030 [Streptomyces sp. Tu 2975]
MGNKRDDDDAVWSVGVGFVGGVLGPALGVWAVYEASVGCTLPLIGYEMPHESFVLGIVLGVVVSPVLFKLGFVVLPAALGADREADTPLRRNPRRADTRKAPAPVGEPEPSVCTPGQRIGMPDRVRAITSRWISLVPSKIV